MCNAVKCRFWTVNAMFFRRIEGPAVARRTLHDRIGPEPIYRLDIFVPSSSSIEDGR
jgi:hypothetical protein